MIDMHGREFDTAAHRGLTHHIEQHHRVDAATQTNGQSRAAPQMPADRRCNPFGQSITYWQLP